MKKLFYIFMFFALALIYTGELQAGNHKKGWGHKHGHGMMKCAECQKLGSMCPACKAKAEAKSGKCKMCEKMGQMCGKCRMKNHKCMACSGDLKEDATGPLCAECDKMHKAGKCPKCGMKMPENSKGVMCPKCSKKSFACPMCQKEGKMCNKCQIAAGKCPMCVKMGEMCPKCKAKQSANEGKCPMCVKMGKTCPKCAAKQKAEDAVTKCAKCGMVLPKGTKGKICPKCAKK